MDYIKQGKLPPKNRDKVSSPDELVARLKGLIGKKIPMTGKPRTDGSNFRKLVTNYLLEKYMPEVSKEYKIIPKRKKGVPTFLREYIDTYIVTTGKAYNLQVWNRDPLSDSIQVDLKNGEVLLARDVRFVFGKIDKNNSIESIIIMTPEYIEKTFGKFSKPTIKHQLIISNKKREEIIKNRSMIIEDRDLTDEVLAKKDMKISKDTKIKDEPDKVLPIESLDERVTDKLLGQCLDVSLSTKQRGQQLERMVAYELGYDGLQDDLEGGYPDIKNQMLEIKVQDSPTIDLGRYSPQFEEHINKNFTTRTVRYLIALTDSQNGMIDGIIICPGDELGKNFTYVSAESYKFQKNIPMSFFEKYKGQVVYNP